MTLWRASLLIVLLPALAACAAPAAQRPATLVVSEASPALTLAVDPAFTALPPLKFPIDNLTNAERRIFVDAGPGGAVERLVIVQFEQVQPGSDFRFLFPSRPPRQFGAQIYRSGTFAFDEAKSAAADPAKEAGHTRRFLAARGYRPARFYRVARLARVSDPQGLSEVIIFYMESADREFGDGPIPGADADGDLVISGVEQEALFARLESAVRVVAG